MYIHELAHYLTNLLAGSWIGRYPIGFSIYHTELGMGGSVLPQFENRPSSTAVRAGLRLLSFQAPTLVWLTLLCGSLALPFPYNGIILAWVLLFVPPQSWHDTHSVHRIVTGLLHSMPDTFPLRARENSLPVWPRIKALAGLTYRVMGWPAFYLKLMLTGIVFLCTPLLQPTANSIRFSYDLDPISFHNELKREQRRQGNAYRQVTSRTYYYRYERHKDIFLKFYFFWYLLTKICGLCAPTALWLFVSAGAIVYAREGNYFLLGYWALYGHFIAGRPGTSWSIIQSILITRRLIRRRRYQAEIAELMRILGQKEASRCPIDS